MGRGWGLEHLLEAILLRTILVRSQANCYYVSCLLSCALLIIHLGLAADSFGALRVHEVACLESFTPAKWPVCADPMNLHAVSEPQF